MNSYIGIAFKHEINSLPMPILQIQNLNAGYGELHILKDVNLELPAGSMSVLMGPNGAGKSTLLKSVYALTTIKDGKVLLEGKNITRLPAHKLLDRGVAYVPQGKVNFGLLTIRENLFMGAHYISDKEELQRRLADVYRQFPVLAQKQKQYAFSLSGGEQQMLAIGRALMSKPKLLLMDEPSLGLAPKLVKTVFESIREIKENFNTTILIVEHNLKSLMDVADYGFILVQGRMVAHDTCSQLKNSDIMQKVFVGKFE